MVAEFVFRDDVEKLKNKMDNGSADELLHAVMKVSDDMYPIMRCDTCSSDDFGCCMLNGCSDEKLIWHTCAEQILKNAESYAVRIRNAREAADHALFESLRKSREEFLKSK